MKDSTSSAFCGATWEQAIGPCIKESPHDVHDDGAGAQWSDAATPSEPKLDEVIYGANKPGWPGFVAIGVTDVPPSKDDRKMIADWLKRGLIIHKTTRHDAVVGFQAYSAEIDRRKDEPPEPAAEEPQIGLFA